MLKHRCLLPISHQIRMQALWYHLRKLRVLALSAAAPAYCPLLPFLMYTLEADISLPACIQCCCSTALPVSTLWSEMRERLWVQVGLGLLKEGKGWGLRSQKRPTSSTPVLSLPQATLHLVSSSLGREDFSHTYCLPLNLLVVPVLSSHRWWWKGLPLLLIWMSINCIWFRSCLAQVCACNQWTVIALLQLTAMVVDEGGW